MKIEAQDQQVPYERVMGTLKNCGFFFSLPVPPDPVLCAMKLSALLSRGKGRDFYDVMFLLARTAPDYAFLAARCGIHNLAELKAALENTLRTVDLGKKRRDFEHLLFQQENSRRILRFPEFIRTL